MKTVEEKHSIWTNKPGGNAGGNFSIATSTTSVNNSPSCSQCTHNPRIKIAILGQHEVGKSGETYCHTSNIKK